jgi:beta-lactamase class A
MTTSRKKASLYRMMRTFFVTALGLSTLALGLWVLKGKPIEQKHPLDCQYGVFSPLDKDLPAMLNKVKKYSQQEINRNEIKDIAVYFRDLKNGSWFAINKDEKFSLASLMKVPLMIECLESAESRPALLRKRMLFTGDVDLTSQQNMKPQKFLEPGRSYSLDELMFRMIAYSDNNAMSMMVKEFPAEEMDTFLARHYLDYEKAPDGYLMSLGMYTMFFDELYDQSFLNPGMSRKALSYLANEDFPQGMHAAVPGNVAVESKFGERVVKDGNGTTISTQLHEVGIVLADGHPFLLGIMTSGTDLTVLEKVIQDITREVYEEDEHMVNANRHAMDCMAQCHIANSGV